jgi:hypothetical protein
MGARTTQVISEARARVLGQTEGSETFDKPADTTERYPAGASFQQLPPATAFLFPAIDTRV